MPLRLAESHRWKREEESGRSSGVMTPVMTVSAHELRLSRLQFFSRFFWFLDGRFGGGDRGKMGDPSSNDTLLRVIKSLVCMSQKMLIVIVNDD